jgi:hypothetical protein
LNGFLTTSGEETVKKEIKIGDTPTYYTGSL